MIENAGLVERLEERAAVRERASVADEKSALFVVAKETRKDAAIIREAAQRIRELEAALAAETERCAKVADHATAEMERIAKLHPGNSIPRDTCFARAREAMKIAAAIRAGAPR